MHACIHNFLQALGSDTMLQGTLRVSWLAVSSMLCSAHHKDGELRQESYREIPILFVMLGRRSERMAVFLGRVTMSAACLRYILVDRHVEKHFVLDRNKTMPGEVLLVVIEWEMPVLGGVRY